MKVRSCVKMADQFPEQAEGDLTYLVDQKNGNPMIRQLLNLVSAKYYDLSVSRRSLLFASAFSYPAVQIIDLLATDKSLNILLNLAQ